ncbi:MAG: hypothetical protein ACLRXQ_09575 [Phascolarctobacterium faecium]
MQHLMEPLWSELTELVALGTVADIVPRGENRAGEAGAGGDGKYRDRRLTEAY